MKIPDDRIEELIEIWERAYGERLSRGDAGIRAIQLIELYRLIMQPLPREQSEPGAAPGSSAVPLDQGGQPSSSTAPQ